MKYGILTMDSPRPFYNIGDAMQILALRNLYEQRGITQETLIPIKVSELSRYQGQPVVLPLSYPFFGYYKLSSSIIPVYLGVSLISSAAAPGLKLREYGPVGCRDAHSFRELQEAGIPSYYAGCMTLTLPRRPAVTKGDRILFVDVPDSLHPYIPEEYRSRAEFSTHSFTDTDFPEEAARERLRYYYDHAELVVTSRIHCAMPCIAAGIPTIFVCERVSFRYTVLESFLPIYTPSNFDQINWNPAPEMYEDLKQSMLNYAWLRIRSAMEGEEIPEEQHRWYQEKLRTRFQFPAKTPYENEVAATFMRYLKRKFRPNERFTYILWGVTQLTELMYQKIQEQYPNAVFAELVDEFREIRFHGKVSVRSEAIRRYPDSVVLVTAGAAYIAAKARFDELGHAQYCICYNGAQIEDGTVISFPH